VYGLSLARLSIRCPDRHERRRTAVIDWRRRKGDGRSTNRQRDAHPFLARAAHSARHTFSEVAGISIAGAPMRASASHSHTDRNPLGVKGVGEAGTLGAIPSVMNAVNGAEDVQFQSA
jgi:CO/xanthine dehydrogenase Mo-binding subunit